MRRFFILCLLLTSRGGWAESVPLYAQIRLQLHPDMQLPLSDTVAFDITTQNAQRALDILKDWPQITATVIDQTTLAVELPVITTFQGEILPRHTASSFVIDTDEQATMQFAKGFTKRESDLRSLAHYVNEYIDQPSYIHGFNIASVVASQRSGDCTEYAVLTTALARMQGLPARVVLGTVIIEGNQEIAAFGHAWTEVYDGHQWSIVDAALLETEAQRRFYLPAGTLDNEGPGFSMNVMEVTTLFPSAITRLTSYDDAN